MSLLIFLVGTNCFKLIQKHVEDILLVSEDEIRKYVYYHYVFFAEGYL